MYYLIYLIASVFSLVGNFKHKTFFLDYLIIILALFAGTRLDIDKDYFMYYKSLLYMDDNLKAFKRREISLEYSMYFFPKFFELFTIDKITVVRSVFLSFAFLGVSTKLIAIRKYSDFFFLSVILYVSYLFFMMEMTTIRAGVAAGIFLLSIKALDEKNDKHFFIFIAFCFFFHSSSILFVLPWVLFKLKIKLKYYYISIFVSLLIALAKVNILTLLFLDRIFPRVEGYIKAMEWMKEDNANIFSFRAVFALLMIVLFSIYYKKIKDVKYFDVLFKMHLISISLFFVLSTSAQVFSIRTFEMFSVVQILLYPMIVNVLHPKFKLAGWLLIIAFSLVQLYFIISVAEIYKPYKSWLF